MSVGTWGDEGSLRRCAGRLCSLAARRRLLLVALLVYVACEFAIWRPGISFGITVGVVGSTPSSDYQVGTWSLEWWPWAILHGVNPLHTGLLWAPSGYSTTWITSVPALALLAAPVTLLAGPLVSYNLLMLAAPVCAALACYVLCRELCERFWPALLGGFLFGFSPYVLAQAVSQHLNLVMVWPLPLLVLIAIRYCRGQTSRRRAIATSAALLLFLFGSSLELFATSLVLGGVVLAVALAFGRNLRVRVAEFALCLGAASAIVLAIAAPFVWLTLVTNRPPLPYAPEQYATDLANVLVPTRITLGGTTSFASAFSRHFVGNLGERDGYLGVPLVAMCLVAAWRDWKRRAWIAATAVAVALALSLGPVLVVAGRTIGDLPFALDRLPAMALVLPSRLAVFVVLAAICLVMPWLARSGRRGLRVAIGVAIALSFAPQPGDLAGARAEAKADRAGVPAVAWEMPRASSGFVRVASRFAAQTTVLALPFGGLSPVSFWQAETGMRFRIAGGYTPFAPAGLATDPLIQGFLRNSVPPLSIYRLRAYLLRSDTRVVLVQAASRAWREVVRAATGERPRRVAGTDVFAVDTRRLRALLVRPRIPARPRRGFTLSPRATPIASLSAASDSRVAVASWLTWDWRTQHVVVQASPRSGAWKRAETLSNPDLEASELSIAVGGRRTIVSWIEARDGVATLRVAEYRGGKWRRVRLSQGGSVAMEAQVAAAPDGTATIAWTVQDGARLILHAARVDARGIPSVARDLSSQPHSVDAFTVAATTGGEAVAWRESDSTSASLMAATLRAGSHGWSQPTVVAAGAGLSAPFISDGRSGPVVVWTSHVGTDAGLHASRIDRSGRAEPQFALVEQRRGQRIATPGVAATAGGVLVAWCANAALRVALITRTSVERGAHPIAPCAGAAPHLLQVGSLTVLNASRAPRLYGLTRRLRCTRLDAVQTAGAYRLIASGRGIEAVSAGGSATSVVVVRALARREPGDQPCR